MKVALVHELLTRRGGAERVAKIVADMFPQAPIYTLLYDEKKMSDLFPKERVRLPNTKLSSVFSLLSSPYNHHLYLSQFPAAVESWDFRGFDVVLSSSSAFVHGIITNSAPKHLCYVHSPARYLWDSTHEVLERAGKGLFGPFKRRYLERTCHPLRIWDAEVASRPNALLANSREVQRRIELYWRRESTVLYPPIDDFWFEREPHKVAMEHPDYYVIVSTLSPYKRIDLAIEACNKRKVHLKIVGEGPARKALEKIAGPTIHFYGHRQNDELIDLIGNAKVLLFPTYDDFGLVPVEAMACGTPVIAYGKGGALETIVEGVTGEFFPEQTAKSLGEAMEKFENGTYDKNACRDRAAQFRKTVFEEAIRQEVQTLLA